MTDHEYLAQVLGAHHPLLIKLTNFRFDHGLFDKPALVLQCRPDDAELDMGLVDARVLLRNGGEGSSDRDWNGFQSANSRVVATFDGLRAGPGDVEPAWATELHRDGHLLAGFWSFQGLPKSDGTEVPGIPFDYANLFADFATMGKNLVDLLPKASAWVMSATLLHPSILNFGGSNNSGHFFTIIPPPSRPALQWPVYKFATKLEAEMAGKKLGRVLLSACRSPDA